jgi:hypothetical protein
MKKLNLTALLALFFLAGFAQSKNFIDQPYIEVNGLADTLLTPNEIYINITIDETDSKNRVSLEAQEVNMYKELKSLGVDVKKDLTSEGISSKFKAYLLKGKDIMKSKTYLLKVADAKTATKVFIALEKIGISNTAIKNVGHSELAKVEIELREKAVENAKIRAKALTKVLNQTIGNAIFISDNSIRNSYDNSVGVLHEVTIKGFDAAQELPDIEFKKIKLSANVGVKFIMKP